MRWSFIIVLLAAITAAWAGLVWLANPRISRAKAQIMLAQTMVAYE